MSANHFKPWTPEDDSRILDDPEASNLTLAAELARSENAIRCRRAHLAVRMHLKHQDIRLEDCCSMLGAEPKRAREYLDEIQARDTSLDQFLKHRKRARDEKPDDEDELPSYDTDDEPTEKAGGHAARAKHAEPAGKRGVQSSRPLKRTPDPEPAYKPTIEDICSEIVNSEGQLSLVWQEEAFVPTIIEHYTGFRAYAEFVATRAAFAP